MCYLPAHPCIPPPFRPPICPPANLPHPRACLQWLLERPQAMQAGMVKDPADSNVVFDASVMPKLVQPGAKRLAGACGGLWSREWLMVAHVVRVSASTSLWWAGTGTACLLTVLLDSWPCLPPSLCCRGGA